MTKTFAQTQSEQRRTNYKNLNSHSFSWHFSNFRRLRFSDVARQLELPMKWTLNKFSRSSQNPMRTRAVRVQTQITFDLLCNSNRSFRNFPLSDISGGSSIIIKLDTLSLVQLTSWKKTSIEFEDSFTDSQSRKGAKFGILSIFL